MGKTKKKDRRPTTRLESDLKSFWQLFSNEKIILKGERKFRLSILKAYAYREYTTKRMGHKLDIARIEFRKHFTGMKQKPSGRCLICGNVAQARHHIVSLCNGGPNTDKNIAMLCNRCHAKIHPYMQKKRKKAKKYKKRKRYSYKPDTTIPLDRYDRNFFNELRIPC